MIKFILRIFVCYRQSGPNVNLRFEEGDREPDRADYRCASRIIEQGTRLPQN
jgi:hypothetical protein